MMIPSIFRMKKDDSDEIIELEVFVTGYFLSAGVPQCSAVMGNGVYFHAASKAFTAQFPQAPANDDSNIITLNPKRPGS